MKKCFYLFNKGIKKRPVLALIDIVKFPCMQKGVVCGQKFVL